MSLTDIDLYVRTTFVSVSDRNAKENFQPVDPRAVLDKVAALPLSEWNYKQDTSTRHIGPMAQDFYAAFHVGPDDKHITTVDERAGQPARLECRHRADRGIHWRSHH